MISYDSNNNNCERQNAVINILISFFLKKKAPTYSVPHDNVDIHAEGVDNMLGDVKIYKITKMVVHINTCEKKSTH